LEAGEHLVAVWPVTRCLRIAASGEADALSSLVLLVLAAAWIVAVSYFFATRD
jgi:hypothetical protein